jgi:mannose-P-dolichol utilization defect protein 1
MEEFLAKCPISDVFHWKAICYQTLISKCLSSGILAGSVALKLPQIMNIISTKDVKGLAPESFYSEVPLTVLTVMYNIRQGYPFLSYGESAVIMVQNVILVLLLWQFMKPSPSVSVITSVLAMFLGVTLGCKMMPPQYLHTLPMLTLPLMVYSRMVQILSSYKQGTTGQLSSITTGLTFLGSLARVFTTISEVGMDLPLLTGFGLGSLLSAVQLGQVSFSTFIFYEIMPTFPLF